VNLKRCGKKWPKPISRYCPSVCTEVEANPGQDKQLELPNTKQVCYLLKHKSE
jgi:hypothetical protein